MATRAETLVTALQSALGDKLVGATAALGEVTAVIRPEHLLAAATALRDAPELKFEELIDLCGVDYRDYGDGAWEGKRFAVVLHLLSVARNQRLRVRVFCPDDEFPVVDSVTGIWPSASWYEREAFDLYGIIFSGHADLRPAEWYRAAVVEGAREHGLPATWIRSLAGPLRRDRE